MSVSDRFFDSDGQLKDIDSVLLDMLEDGFVTVTDKYFSVENLASNFTRTSIYLREGVGSEFFKDLHRDILWPADLNHEYPDVTFSWNNQEVAELEAYDAFMHDAYWSAGTFIVVGILVLLKIRNIFVFMAAMT
eukprot:4404401-Ditylum_brightwellii.AAC.1